MEQALPTCMECHEDLEDDESLPKLFELLDEIAEAERRYVETANRLDEVGRGVLLVDNQRFKFEDAKTHLIELAPLQHALDNSVVAEKVAKLNEVCSQVNRELDELERGLHWRRMALIPIWLFALVFAGGHVDRSEHPLVGLGRDNIYTYWSNGAQSLQPQKELGLWIPGVISGRSPGASHKSDSYLGN